MQKRTVVLIVCFVVIGLLSPQIASADDATANRSLTFSPLGFIFRVYNLNYEQALGDKLSMVVGGQFLSWNLGALGSVNAFGAIAGANYYLQGTAIEGFYVGPQASVAYATGGDPKTSAFTIGAAGLAGFKWVSSGGFTTNVSAGLAFSMPIGGEVAGLGGGIAPQLGLGLGYAW